MSQHPVNLNSSLTEVFSDLGGPKQKDMLVLSPSVKLVVTKPDNFKLRYLNNIILCGR